MDLHVTAARTSSELTAKVLASGPLFPAQVGAATLAQTGSSPTKCAVYKMYNSYLRRMTEFSLPWVSVSSSGGEYFQVCFAHDEETDQAYF